MKRGDICFACLVVLIVAVGIGAYYLGQQAVKVDRLPVPIEETPTPIDEPAELPPTEPAATLPPGWVTYNHIDPDFTLSYPNADCSALDDPTNLYGWPNGLVLVYCGGQSYDIAVEMWSSEAAYLATHPTYADTVLAYEVPGGYLTVTDITQEPVNADILNTFEVPPTP